MSTSRWRKQFRKFAKTAGNKFSGDKSFLFSQFIQQSSDETRLSASRGQGPKGRAAAARMARRSRTEILRQAKTRRKNYVVHDPDVLGFRYKEDYLIEGLIPNFGKNFVDIHKRLKRKKYAQIELNEFSFIDNPSGTLRQLMAVASAASEYIDVQLAFTDPACRDISAYMALALMMRSLPGVFSGGTISPEMAKVLSSVGLARRLGIGALEAHRGPRSLILPFRMKTRVQPQKFSDPNHQLKPQAKEKIADEFCTALEGWLGVHEITLNPEAQGSIIETITEALDNAERHGWPDDRDTMGDWSVAGFSRLNVSDDAEISVECCFAIVNIGETISESLDSAAPEVAQRISQYVDAHSRKGNVLPSTLRTVMALQDGVTRIAAATQGRRGGLGLMALTQIVSELGGQGSGDMGSQLSIVSGNSYLRMANPYRCGISSDPGGLKELWFNPTNCAKERPDPSHVMDFSENFPGTVISARFSIDPAFLIQKISNDGLDTNASD